MTASLAISAYIRLAWGRNQYGGISSAVINRSEDVRPRSDVGSCHFRWHSGSMLSFGCRARGWSTTMQLLRAVARLARPFSSCHGGRCNDADTIALRRDRSSAGNSKKMNATIFACRQGDDVSAQNLQYLNASVQEKP
jgi:hypothetical protein